MAGPMTVSVSFYSYFKDLAGSAGWEEQLPAGARVSDLLERVGQRAPRMREAERCMLIAVGVEYQTRDHVLAEGDQVSLFPPVQGG